MVQRKAPRGRHPAKLWLIIKEKAKNKWGIEVERGQIVKALFFVISATLLIGGAIAVCVSG